MMKMVVYVVQDDRTTDVTSLQLLKRFHEEQALKDAAYLLNLQKVWETRVTKEEARSLISNRGKERRARRVGSGRLETGWPLTLCKSRWMIVEKSTGTELCQE
jgi:hypothetical protein